MIEWDWAAGGIWIVPTPEEMTAPGPGARLTAGGAPKDRHAAWRGLLSDELIDALQAWNDYGEEVMGIDGHRSLTCGACRVLGAWPGTRHPRAATARP